MRDDSRPPLRPSTPSPTLMRFRTSLSALRRRATLGATLLLGGAVGLGAVACRNDLNVTDPNAPSSTTFFKTANDAEAALIAAYNPLLRLGTFQRWQAFSYDLRSDIGTSTSPWPELQAFVKFQFPSGYDFDVNRDTWNETYTLIANANQVTENVPGIQMDETRRAQIVGEAKFLRGVGYFHLMTLYGGHIPIITKPVSPTERPASSDSAAVWAQIEQDFSDAAAALPEGQTMTTTGGRATHDAAQGMLGKTYLQEGQWQKAAAALQPIIQSGHYTLVADYATLFRQEGNNGPESLFEVQVGSEPLCSSQGICGLNIAKMVGPCGPSYCDGLPTKWYKDQFFLEPSAGLDHDKRIDATLYYYRGDTTMVYAKTWAQWQADDPGHYSDHSRLYFKKYGEYYLGRNDQSWESQINYKVLRFADVLLMYAEALNEQGQTGGAYVYVDSVRHRAGLGSLPQTLSQAGMRDEILHQRLLEFGLEGQRWLDLGRQKLFETDLPALIAHDADFNNFVQGKSELLPIPQAERNLNPNIQQNPGW